MTAPTSQAANLALAAQRGLTVDPTTGLILLTTTPTLSAAAGAVASVGNVSDVRALSLNTRRPLSANYIIDNNFSCGLAQGWTQLGAASVSLGTTLAYPTAFVNSSSGNGGNSSLFQASAGTGGANTSTFGSALTYAEGQVVKPSVYGDVGYTHVLDFNQTTASTGTANTLTAPTIAYPMIGNAALAGKSAVFGCWLWTVSGTITITSLFFSRVDTSAPSIMPVNWVITTTPQFFAYNFTPGNNAAASSAYDPSNTGVSYIGVIFPVGSTYEVRTTGWYLMEIRAADVVTEQTGQGGLMLPAPIYDIAADMVRYSSLFQINQYLTYGYGAASGYFSCPMNYLMRKTPVATLLYTMSTNNCTLTGAAIRSATTGYILANITAAGLASFTAAYQLDARPGL